MLDAGQLRVETLRRRLDESLASHQKSANQKDRDARSLHIVRVSTKEAFVEIGEHGARPRLDRVLSSSPLNVICDGSSMGDLATSPAESIDSGISLSPVTSPVGKHSPFYQYSEENRLGMRQRSASESEWASEGLKGILKKPSLRAQRLARSVSESCHSHPLGPFGLIGTLEEEEEDVGAYVEEGEDEGHTDEPARIASRKKRVSFSEKLEQCRRFRPNQCILSQARKNEKKRQQKRRKDDERRRSCGSESDGQEIAEPTKPCLRNERQDSGFVDSTDSPPSSPLPSEERTWSDLIRQQRKAVSDRA
ncbi:unnamed protein product [Auanema sp. JU1783]|nr:unnamed protein product [Auanema sp. JU1783]